MVDYEQSVGWICPQVQVQPQVYYFGNSQPQPQLQIANDYGNVQPQLQLQLQPQVHYFNNSQPQLQPQFANDNAAFISNPAPQPQQAVYSFSQQQPLVQQLQLQVQPQVYWLICYFIIMLSLLKIFHFIFLHYHVNLFYFSRLRVTILCSLSTPRWLSLLDNHINM